MTEKNDDMNEQRTRGTSRRRVLEMMGGLAVAVPVVGLSGCGGGDTADSASGTASTASGAADTAAGKLQSAADSMADMADMAEEKAGMAEEKAGEMMAEAEEMAEEVTARAETIASDGMARVDENGAQAMGLGYRHDAGTIDAGSQPRYAAGQQCSNCVLYQGGDAEWGGCGLFAGQQVKATGWCSAYTPAG